jgi:hypothetical protein
LDWSVSTHEGSLLQKFFKSAGLLLQDTYVPQYTSVLAPTSSESLSSMTSSGNRFDALQEEEIDFDEEFEDELSMDDSEASETSQ